MYRVIGTEEFDISFNKIKLKAISENGQAIELKKLIEKGIEKLKYDYKYGEHITKKQIPIEYKKKYCVENLWKLNLNSFWRMIYTIR